MKSEKNKSFVKNMVALCGGSVIALVLLEIALQIYNPLQSRLKGDEIVLPANKVYAFEGGKLRDTDLKIVHTKNSLGFRGPDLPSDGLQDFLSIVVVGGSTTECVYLSDGKDWPNVLYRHLKDDFDSLWLNNAGLDGHSTFGHTILLRDILVGLKPTVALFLIGINEVGRSEAGEHTAAHIKGNLRLYSIEGLLKSTAAYS